MALAGFAPDAAMMTPGVLLDCAALIPAPAGMAAAPTIAKVGIDALADVRGALVSIDLSGARAIYAATGTAIKVASGTTWADVSGGPFALGVGEKWSMAQLGDSAIASCKSVGMRIATGGNFAAISGAPKAKIVESLAGFVMAFDTSEATYGDSPDRWWCSAYANASDWTPNVATLCTTGRLVESGGAISAALRLGPDIVVYKSRATYLGRYTGPAEVWNFAQIDANVGCVGQNAVCSSGKTHYFIGADDIYAFDGVRVQSIARGVLRDWFNATRDPEQLFNAQAYWDAGRQLAWFFFDATDGTHVGLVYDPATGRWGRADFDVCAPIRYATPAATYDSGSPVLTTYDTPVNISYDSPFWTQQQETMGAFDADGSIVTFSGRPAQSSFTTGDYGAETGQTMCDRLVLRLQGEPDSAQATGYVKDNAGLTVQAGSTAIRDDGAFDMRQRARWHRFKVDAVGPYTLIDIQPNLKQAGFR